MQNIDSSLPVINEREENKDFEFIEEPPIINIEDQIEEFKNESAPSHNGRNGDNMRERPLIKQMTIASGLHFGNDIIQIDDEDRMRIER